MVYFVGTSPSLRKVLLVAMAAMHLHIAQTGLFMGIYGPRYQFGTKSKLSLWCNAGQIRYWGS